MSPGLTGLAQVSGRNAISWEEKFDFDGRYVESITLKKDSWIILLTCKKVLAKEGISSQTGETMEPFTGFGSGSS